jgi:hypothetical protein
MTRQELELKAKEFDSKLKRHPMSSEELQNVLCDFVEALRIHDVVGQSEQFYCASEKDNRYERCEEQCHLCKMDY